MLIPFELQAQGQPISDSGFQIPANPLGNTAIPPTTPTYLPESEIRNLESLSLSKMAGGRLFSMVYFAFYLVPLAWSVPE